MIVFRRKIYATAGLVAILFVPLFFLLRGPWREQEESFAREFKVRQGVIDWHIAARGRVEGVSAPEIKLAPRTVGRLQQVPVADGDPVRRGQIVAILDNKDIEARRDEARARLARAQAMLERLLNGARPEERSAAWAEVQEAQALADNAQQNYGRAKRLYEEGEVLSRARLDQFERDWKMAQAKLDSAQQRYQFLVAPPRPEDTAAAHADVALARAQLAAVQDEYENTFIRSPINGVVIKRFMNPGEAISFQTLSEPIVSVADTTKLMVRAEIDETDIGKVRVGQPAQVTTGAFPGQSFQAHVVRLSGGLGRKKITTDNPTDKLDTEVLETFLELEPNTPLRVGLRVDVMVQLAYKANVLIAPVRAVIHRDGQTMVRLRTPSGVSSRPVRLGLHDGMFVEVLEGLSPGDRVVY